MGIFKALKIHLIIPDITSSAFESTFEAQHKLCCIHRLNETGKERRYVTARKRLAR